MFLPHDFVAARTLARQAFLQPVHRGRGAGILIAQALGQLHGKDGRQRLAAGPPGGKRIGIDRMAAHAQQPVGQRVGFPPFAVVAHDGIGGAAKIFHQHDAQGYGDGPEFADGQRLHLLIGADESGQDIRIEAAVRMSDESPGDAEDPRIGLERSVGEFRQLTVISRRQAGANFANLFGHHVGIVDQPFRGGGDRALIVDRQGDVPVSGPQPCIVVAKPGLEIAAGTAGGRLRFVLQQGYGRAAPAAPC